jgi:TRAP-type mannitol/chloroaromatic compound transport system permease small subunit
MQTLLAISRGIDALTAFVGRWVYWLILAAVLVSAGNAIVRKVLDISSNAWLELQWYLFGAAYLLASAYTLQRNDHIRIDILSNALPKRVRDWIDVFGHIVMLLPFAGLMVYESWPFFYNSFISGEMSGSAGGLILWPARLMLFLGFTLLLLQGLSELIKRVAILRGDMEEPGAPSERADQVPIK